MGVSLWGVLLWGYCCRGVLWGSCYGGVLLCGVSCCVGVLLWGVLL